MSISSCVSRRSTSKLPSPSKKKRPGGRWFETVVRPVGAEEDRQFFNAQASWAVSCGEYVCRNTDNTPLVQGDRATRNTRGRGCCGWSDMAEPPEITAPTPLSTPPPHPF